MHMKHAAVAAGLALGLMSGTARAASITYNVNLTLTGGTIVTGFIVTDGAIGDIHKKDIVDLDIYSGHTYVSDADLENGSLYLQATLGQLTFLGGRSYININGANGVVTTNSFAESSALYFSDEYVDLPSGRRFLLDGVAIPEGGAYVIGTVPLPASAPMFSAALLGLGGLGYAAKRKKAAAAA